MHCWQNPVFARNRICSDVRGLGTDYWDRQTCPCLCACLYNTTVKKEVKMWPGYMICYTDSVSRPVLNGQIPAGISLSPGTPASPGIQQKSRQDRNPGSIRVPEDRAWILLLYLFPAICQWSVVTGEPFIYNRNRNLNSSGQSRFVFSSYQCFHCREGRMLIRSQSLLCGRAGLIISQDWLLTDSTKKLEQTLKI